MQGSLALLHPLTHSYLLVLLEPNRIRLYNVLVAGEEVIMLSSVLIAPLTLALKQKPIDFEDEIMDPCLKAEAY